MSEQERHGCYLRAYVPGNGAVTRKISTFPCRIGRVETNDVVLSDPSVSTVHAVLVQDTDGRIYLEDEWSASGVCREGEKEEQIPVDGPVRVLCGNSVLDLAFSEEELDALEPPEMPESRPQDAVSAEGAATMSRNGEKTRGTIICPHCWHSFDVSDFLFIARHQSLVGDPVLGADAAQRFLPSRFTPEGNALDAAGMSCPDMACPRCHLRIPQAASEMPPLFLSIVGATASGKSYFLTSMTWDLRNTLSRNFAIAFTDTDAVNNQILNDFEETVFLNADSDTPVALRKTELQGELYNQVLLDNMLINLPKPFLFTVMPAEHHPRYDEVRGLMSRTLVLYDNAGEHFEPGMDSVDNPTTQHLLHSDTILFLFDPTKDVRFRRRIKGSEDPQMAPNSRVQRQEIILTEMINRIKKYSGMRNGTKTAKTLILLVSKFDIWKQLLDFDIPAEPWQWVPEYNTCALDVDFIKNVSFALRTLLEELCPEIVTTAESFAGEVLYLPDSALGHSPEVDQETGMIGIRPRDVQPFWVSVPMLYFFYEKGFLQRLPEGMRTRYPEGECQCTLSGDIYFVKLPGVTKPLQVPVSFAGYQLRLPGADTWFTVPKPEGK